MPRPALARFGARTRRRCAGCLLAAWLLLAACAPPPAPAPLPTLAILAPTPAPATPSPAPANQAVAAQPLTPALPAAPPTAAIATPTASPSASPSAPATSSPTPTPAGCEQPGAIVDVTYPSVVDGPERTYRLYMPPCYGDDGRVYPTLILLHGLGLDQDETTWDDLGVDEALDEAVRAGALPPFLVVMPAGGWAAQFTSGGPGSFETVVLEALLPHVAANACAWEQPAGWAIGGLSRGAYWALEIAFRHAERFVGVGGHSAALLDIGAGPDLNPQFTALSRDLGDLRIYLDVGDADFGMLPNVTRLHEDLVAAGIPHEWHLNPGGHTNDYWAEHLPDYLAWYGSLWPADRDAYPRCSLDGRPVGSQ